VCRELEDLRTEHRELMLWIQENREVPIHRKRISNYEADLKEIEKNISVLEQKEQDIINKFETKMINVLQTIDVVLEEISKECDGDSKLKLFLMIDGRKA
jgi:hypothetical protein